MKALLVTSVFCFLIATSACSLARGVAVSSTTPTVDRGPVNGSVGSASAGGSAFQVDQAGSSVTGTYELKADGRANEFKVQQSAQDQITVLFDGSGEFKSQAGPMANTGTIGPITIKLEGQKAVLTTPDAEGCRIVLAFTGDKLVAQQNENECGLPGGVYAGGTYHKTSSKDPFLGESSGGASEARFDDLNNKNIDTAIRRIRFATGTSSAVVSGKITDGVDLSYTVGARAGQTLEVEIVEGDVVVDAISSGNGRLPSDDSSGTLWRGRLPKTGDYLVIVNSVERKDVEFKIRVTIR